MLTIFKASRLKQLQRHHIFLHFQSNYSSQLTTSTKLSPQAKEDPSENVIFNEALIQIISPKMHRHLFGPHAPQLHETANISEVICNNLGKHNIKPSKTPDVKPPVEFPLPPLHKKAQNVEEHFYHIAQDLAAPYVSGAAHLLECFTNGHLPPMPETWQLQEGWTKYERDGSWSQVAVPDSACLVFDVEVLVKNRSSPCLAVALSPDAWHLWCSSDLVANKPLDLTASPLTLIPFYQASGCRTKSEPKLLIGHFVSFDRARILDEYCLQSTGLRFLDTMSLHISVGGLTSYQRVIKRMANKRQFTSKVWDEFATSHGLGSQEEDATEEGNGEESKLLGLEWLKDSSLNSLLDLHRRYVDGPPPQTKELRDIFIEGSLQDVVDNFQDLARYCALDVYMTLEIFAKLWPAYQQRFPHPVTTMGMLEMSSMYLPVNANWMRFQDKAATTFSHYTASTKSHLTRLATEALQMAVDEKYKTDPWLWDLDWTVPKGNKNTPPELVGKPKWYRALIPSPLAENASKGPLLLSPSRRIAPKLLRLLWEGVPLHHDHDLKWGFLIPGRLPETTSLISKSADKAKSEKEEAPKFLSYYRETESGEMVLNDLIPVTSSTASAPKDLFFPYKAYLKFWTSRIQAKLRGILSHVESNTRSGKNSKLESLSRLRDGRLVEELGRLFSIIPVDKEEKDKYYATLQVIKSYRPWSSEMEETAKQRPYGSSSGTDGDGLQIPNLLNRGEDFFKEERRHSAKFPQIRATSDPEIPTCWFAFLPHAQGYGTPVGSPLSKTFRHHIREGRVTSALGEDANELLSRHIACSFWQSYCKRINSQLAYFWSEDGKELMDSVHSSVLEAATSGSRPLVGAILPQLITAGTVTRRAVERLWLTASNAEEDRMGSEVKAMVQAPADYCFVGADVDSQEMWIASALGDSLHGVHGATPYGWMTLQGSKAEGTDLHTRTANILRISRDNAKVFNYARLYGAGIEHSKQLLMNFDPSIQEADALSKAKSLMLETKGRRDSKGRWSGGTESEVFNQLESIAKSAEPRTPVLQCSISRALNPAAVKDDFMTSRMNWVVQSSGVDYLHCLLVMMRWLLREWSLEDRVRLCISIHDEVRYLSLESAKYQVALALQCSNLFTRALFASKMGLLSLPEGVAFFSSVEVDRCIRKDVRDECLTPSNPEGIHTSYGIPPGESLDIRELLEKNIIPPNCGQMGGVTS